MPFNLTMGTERANALQQSIQDELIKRGYSPEADPVMAEYITIMVINNKSAAQITAELEDLIGSEFDPAFTDWLFAEAAKGSTGAVVPSQPQSPTPPSQPTEQPPAREPPPVQAPRDNSSRPSHPPRNGVYQQAVSQATSSGSSQKRSASARSPSPNQPNKSRRMDLPTGPRAMQRDGSSSSNPRSLLDRMGGHAGPNRHQRDEIQARIDNITNNPADPNMMMAGGFPGMPMGGMDMNAMAMAANPLMLQDMFMSNMALMQQLSSQIGMMQGFANGPPGFNMPGGVPPDMAMFPGGPNNFGPAPRGRGGARGGRGTGRGGSSHAGASSSSKPAETNTNSDSAAAPSNPPSQPPSSAAPPVAPAVPAPTALAAPTTTNSQLPYAVPERPQSPTLCKFGLKCTNVHCRWSHPSPVATPESGVVLSNEACENGINCKDKDCIKAHVSPAILNPTAQSSAPAPAPVPVPAPAPVVHRAPSNPVPCRFGLACTRPNCMFSHPRPATNPQHATPCRFGTACTRATCPYQHPEGRVLPTSFHRGLAPSGTAFNASASEAGTVGPSPHKSMTFNNPKAKLEKQMKELEEKKNEAEKAIKDAQATTNANGNATGEDPKTVATAA